MLAGIETSSRELRPMSSPSALYFGPYCLLPSQRRLIEDGRGVRLGSRAFDILVALAEHAGEVVPNSELIARVWPNMVVEPGALRVHIAGLRKVLGDGRAGQRYVVNVPSQGYCFVAPVSRGSPPATSTDAVAPAQPSAIPTATPIAAPLPAQINRMIGRDTDLAAVMREMAQRRCITLTGPGGMGKTTLALMAARHAAPTFDGQVAFVNLAPLADPSLLIGAMFSALGLSAAPGDPLRGLLNGLRDRRVLLVLDNAEHLIEAVALLAEQVLQGAPRAQLLVTSREPLRVPGEWVYRLASLDVPPPLAHLTAQQALQVSSVELFIERTMACVDVFEFVDADAPAVAEVCRALDGIPLALELAASGVERLGVRGVAANLGNRLSLLTRGRRTAVPRHQTLRATLDWGYDLLPAAEQQLLRTLSIFRGRFTADSAKAVFDPASSHTVHEMLFNLAGKSFLSSDVSGETVQYWLLATTREYAAALREADEETEAVARRHARHMLTLADAAERERAGMPAADWLANHAYRVDDHRAALEWSLGSGHDVALGVALASACAPLWFALSLMAEYLELSERALAALKDGTALEPHREMALCEAHGNAWWHMRGTGEQAEITFTRSLALAKRVGSQVDVMRSLWGLWLIACSTGEYAKALQLADRFGAAAACSDDAASAVMHHRMMSLTLHHVGRHAEARMHVQWVLDHPSTRNAAAGNSGLHFDQRVAMLTFLVRILWMLGQADQALERAREAIERALNIDHSLSLCFTLAMGCTPVAIWAGDWEKAARYTQLLQERSALASLAYWQAFGAGYALVLRRREGSVEPFETLEHRPSWVTLKDTLCSCDEGLADEATLARGETGAAVWCAPELLRQRGERAIAAGDAAAARQWFDRGLQLARQQGALSWELRCTISLAKSLRASGEFDKSRALLAPVMQRFTEGFGSADLRHAAALLTE
jgi:predicted ATPase/DNA-binding winged helix-turn-helix (wHTH) protein